MGVVKARGAVVELMAARSVERECRVTCIEAGNALAERKVIQTLGVGVVSEDGEAV